MATHIAQKSVNRLFSVRLSPIGYIRSVFVDARAALSRTIRDRAGLAAIILFVLPWFSLIWLRKDAGWLESFSEMTVVIIVFWWMSRSGSRPATSIKRPMLESVFAIALTILWVEWRAVICTQSLPFIPSNLNCYQNAEYEIGPKLLETTVFPFLVLIVAGYRWRAQGIDWNWRSWWVSLPILIAAAIFGFYMHSGKPMDFVTGTGNFVLGAGLPEEFLFRSLLLTRLEAWWKSPGWALFGASVIFGLSHLPIDFLVFTKHDWRETWITLLTFQMGFGFAFGFAYQRVRNVWPIALLHAMVDAF